MVKNQFGDIVVSSWPDIFCWITDQGEEIISIICRFPQTSSTAFIPLKVVRRSGDIDRAFDNWIWKCRKLMAIRAVVWVAIGIKTVINGDPTDTTILRSKETSVTVYINHLWVDW